MTKQLYRFFDKDDSDSVDLEEIEKTLDWGRKRESMRPLLAGWRQVALSVGDTDTKALMARLREKMVENEVSSFELFKKSDVDGSGGLSKSELAEVMLNLGGMTLSEPELADMFRSLDADGSGEVSWKELTAKLRSELPVEQLLNALSAVSSQLFELVQEWDTNGDGVLSKDEFAAAVAAMGVDATEENVNDLFALFDEDGSGSITAKELEHALRWVQGCEQCEHLRNEAYKFEGTLSIQDQIRHALVRNAVRVMDLFREWDTNDDGLVSKEEFLRAMPLLGIQAARSEVTALFEMLDVDADGVITFREFNRSLRREVNADVEGSPFYAEAHTEWRPKSPTVPVVKLDDLRTQLKLEHKLRGLDVSPIERDAWAGLI